MTEYTYGAVNVDVMLPIRRFRFKARGEADQVSLHCPLLDALWVRGSSTSERIWTYSYGTPVTYKGLAHLIARPKFLDATYQLIQVSMRPTIAVQRFAVLDSHWCLATARLQSDVPSPCIYRYAYWTNVHLDPFCKGNISATSAYRGNVGDSNVVVRHRPR
jgi:hypothetical protein